MFYCEVFQHFSDFAVFDQYMRDVYKMLAPDGTSAFQVPVEALHPYSSIRQLVRRIARTVARAVGVRRMMEYRHYQAPRVLATLHDAGYTDCELRAFRVADHTGAHAYFFARKPHAGR